MPRNSFEHNGDTQSPGEFGFDLTVHEDRLKWAEITGEVAIVSDFTEVEASLVNELVENGYSREVAVQTVLYERLG